jgi:integral membrane protein
VSTLNAQTATGFTPRRLFVALAVAEAITWTALIVSQIVKEPLGLNAITLTAIGAVHGFVFISYGATAILVAINQRWHFGIGLLAVVAALLPYATIPLEIVQAKRGALNGPWRLEASEDPRDNHWFDRFVRWFLNRPVLLVIAILLAVVAIFASLLLAGPPGGK